MTKYSIKFVIFTICVKWVWCLPLKLAAETDKNTLIESKVPNIKVETEILNTYVSLDDTEAQNEVKKLIDQHLGALMSHWKSLIPSSKSSKVEKNHFTSSEEDKLRDRIMAALNDAKNEENGNVNLIGQQKETTELAHSNTTETPLPSNITETPLLSNTETSTQLTVEQPFETNYTNQIYKYPPTVGDLIEEFIANIRKGNVSGVVENGLKLATLEKIGQGLRESVNYALLYALERYLTLNLRLRTITQRLRNPQISFLQAFRIPRSPVTSKMATS